ncbi:MAG: leucyl/phenylalanyl-tRNA--protein transferase, partial [Candidatus Aminicenantes bacterium]|nr:leucyl/phenylalanyl-tRNA--protein transferase [Candidatus Aminicenantes bacterium]
MAQTLTPDILLFAYQKGLFPMGAADGSIEWYFPDPRGVFDLEQFHIPKRLARTIQKRLFDIRFDYDFESVMRGCADRPETWINEPIIKVYTDLFRLGKAHSVEAYRNEKLVGGIYGVNIGGAFMGESMFSRKTDASKVCLVHLAQHLKNREFSLFDIQFINTHLI